MFFFLFQTKKKEGGGVEQRVGGVGRDVPTASSLPFRDNSNAPELFSCFFMVIVFLLTNPSHVLKYDDITRQPYRNLIDSSLHIISILPRRKYQHNNNNNNILIVVVAMVVIREEMTLMIHNMQNHWDLSMVCILLLLFKMKRTLVGREIY